MSLKTSTRLEGPGQPFTSSSHTLLSAVLFTRIAQGPIDEIAYEINELHTTELGRHTFGGHMTRIATVAILALSSTTGSDRGSSLLVKFPNRQEIAIPNVPSLGSSSDLRAADPVERGSPATQSHLENIYVEVTIVTCAIPRVTLRLPFWDVRSETPLHATHGKNEPCRVSGRQQH